MDSRSQQLRMHEEGQDRVIHEHTTHAHTHVCTAYNYAKRKVRPGCSSRPPRPVSVPGVTDSVINPIQLR